MNLDGFTSISPSADNLPSLSFGPDIPLLCDAILFGETLCGVSPIIHIQRLAEWGQRPDNQPNVQVDEDLFPRVKGGAG